MKKVLCLYRFRPEVMERLRAVSPDVLVTFGGPDSQPTVDALEDPELDALLANFCPADLHRLPRLRWLAAVGAGVEHLRSGNPWGHGVTVTNGSGLHGTAMAEYVMAALLRASQRLPERERNQLARGWPAAWTGEWKAMLGEPLRGRTVTIVGYGSIGRETARLARAFGMRVLAVKANPASRLDRGYAPLGVGDPDGSIPEEIGDVAALPGFLGRSDYLVITVPATRATARLIDAAMLAHLPPHAVLVNVARGAVLDEEALCEALRSGGLRGAVLDVATTEPVTPASPLWSTPNLMLTPHVSGINDPEGFWDLVAPLMAENLRRFADGRELLNVTDGAAGY